jgi:hypothetical protein
VLSEIGEHLKLRLSQPLFGVVDAGRSEQLRGATPLGGYEVARCSGMDQSGDWWGGYPQRAAHAVVPDEDAIGIQGLFDRLN